MFLTQHRINEKPQREATIKRYSWRINPPTPTHTHSEIWGNATLQIFCWLVPELTSLVSTKISHSALQAPSGNELSIFSTTTTKVWTTVILSNCSYKTFVTWCTLAKQHREQQGLFANLKALKIIMWELLCIRANPCLYWLESLPQGDESEAWPHLLPYGSFE